MISRDMVQGFLDGYITVGGDPAKIAMALQQYLSVNPTYNISVLESKSILGDIATYRISPQSVLAPTPVPVIAPSSNG